MTSADLDEIYVDHFYLKSYGLMVFRARFVKGATILWIPRNDMLDTLYALQLKKLQAKKKGG